MSTTLIVHFSREDRVCITFIDEIDAIGATCGSVIGVGKRREVVQL